MSRRDKWRSHRRNHAKIRAAERYGACLTRQDLANIVGMIRNGKTKPLARLTCSKRLHLVDYQGQEFLTLYSTRHQEVITFLPPEKEGRSHGVG